MPEQQQQRQSGKSQLSCTDARELIGNDLDRELTLEMRHRLRQHLSACDECRAEAQSLAQSLREIRRVGASEPAPEWYADRTLDRLLDEYESAVGDADEIESPADQLELWPKA